MHISIYGSSEENLRPCRGTGPAGPPGCSKVACVAAPPSFKACVNSLEIVSKNINKKKTKYFYIARRLSKQTNFKIFLDSPEIISKSTNFTILLDSPEFFKALQISKYFQIVRGFFPKIRVSEYF